MKDSSSPLSCVIIDDEVHCIERLRQCLQFIPRFDLTKVYTNPLEAVKEISLAKKSIDFLFMDIDMPQLSGLDLALAIRNKVDKLIFVTAHAKYSLRAYDVLCNQYLLKPFTNEQFLSCVTKLMDSSPADPKNQLEFIFVKDGQNGKYAKIMCEEIIFINALEHYVTIHTQDKKYIQHVSIKDAEVSLSPNSDFIRIHKSYIVSKRHIKSIQANSVVMGNQLEITIGSTYKAAFGAFIDLNSLG